MFSLLPNLSTIYLARGGGGGSSSGGGGGGGAYAAAYVIGHGAGHFARRRTHGVVSLSIMIGAGLAFVALGFLGFLFASFSIVALLGLFAGRFGWFDAVGKMMQRGKKVAAEAAQTDRKFDEKTLIPHMNELFVRFQNDWQNFNTDSMRSYLTPRYWEHIRLQLAALYMLGRQNLMDNIQIYQTGITSVVNAAENTGDRIEIAFNGSMNDVLSERATQRTLMTDKNEFTEFWEMVGSDSGWLLDGIRQSTQETMKVRADIASFAASHNLFYSADWGRLLLPERGELFSGATFKMSDINNHCIGLYHNVLIQLYTYQPVPNQSGYDKIIAQVSVPKTYGRILVRPKRSVAQRLLSTNIFGRNDPKALHRLETEWNDFNQRYELWADNAEQVTSFELLHPSYMEQLYAISFPITIEVVDNIIYLACDNAQGNYETLLACLERAFQELKM